MTYATAHYNDGEIMGTMTSSRPRGNPYSNNRDDKGRYKIVARSLTLRDKVRRRYPNKVYASLSATEYQCLKELSIKINVHMSDILAYLITNHLEQLALQASYEQGRIDASDNSQDSAENTLP